MTARILLVLAMMTALADPAWAYVDPNAGGLIFQIAMPILSLGVAAVTVLRKRIVEFVKRLAFANTSSTQADQNAPKE